MLTQEIAPCQIITNLHLVKVRDINNNKPPPGLEEMPEGWTTTSMKIGIREVLVSQETTLVAIIADMISLTSRHQAVELSHPIHKIPEEV